MSREAYASSPRPVDGIIEQLDICAKRVRTHYNNVLRRWNLRRDFYIRKELSLKDFPPEPAIPFIFLCTSTDPYQPINDEHQLTRKAIEVLHKHGLGVTILTKGIITDWDVLKKNPELVEVGISLSGDEGKYEKNIPTLDKRLDNLAQAKNHNIKTWVLFEPVVDIYNVLTFIKESPHMKDNIDEIRIGKFLYLDESRDIDWYSFGHNIEKLCQILNIKYHIKDALRKDMVEKFTPGECHKQQYQTELKALSGLILKIKGKYRRMWGKKYYEKHKDDPDLVTIVYRCDVCNYWHLDRKVRVIDDFEYIDVES
jgi:DNA repair photolyase